MAMNFLLNKPAAKNVLLASAEVGRTVFSASYTLDTFDVSLNIKLEETEFLCKISFLSLLWIVIYSMSILNHPV